MSEVEPERGDVWWVRFDPAEGSEARKTRPAVVISTPALARVPVRIVVPLTTWQPRFEEHVNKVRVGRTDDNNLDVDSAADTLLLRGVALTRFEDFIGRVDGAVLAEIVSGVALAIRFPDRP